MSLCFSLASFAGQRFRKYTQGHGRTCARQSFFFSTEVGKSRELLSFGKERQWGVNELDLGAASYDHV